MTRLRAAAQRSRRRVCNNNGRGFAFGAARTSGAAARGSIMCSGGSHCAARQRRGSAARSHRKERRPQRIECLRARAPTGAAKPLSRWPSKRSQWAAAAAAADAVARMLMRPSLRPAPASGCVASPSVAPSRGKFVGVCGAAAKGAPALKIARPLPASLLALVARLFPALTY